MPCTRDRARSPSVPGRRLSHAVGATRDGCAVLSCSGLGAACSHPRCSFLLAGGITHFQPRVGDTVGLEDAQGSGRPIWWRSARWLMMENAVDANASLARAQPGQASVQAAARCPSSGRWGRSRV